MIVSPIADPFCSVPVISKGSPTHGTGMVNERRRGVGIHPDPERVSQVVDLCSADNDDGISARGNSAKKRGVVSTFFY